MTVPFFLVPLQPELAEGQENDILFPMLPNIMTR